MLAYKGTVRPTCHGDCSVYNYTDSKTVIEENHGFFNLSVNVSVESDGVGLSLRSVIWRKVEYWIYTVVRKSGGSSANSKGLRVTD